MYCLTNNSKCVASKNTKPFCELIIIIDKKENFCSNKCKNVIINDMLKNDIENNMFLEKFFEECPLCSNNDLFLIELSCNHKMCNQCLKKVFDTSIKCPTCRTLIIMKSENDKLSEFYRESITSEHSYLIDTIYKLINSIDYEFDKELLESCYFARTNRDLKNDLIVIKEYFNMF